MSDENFKKEVEDMVEMIYILRRIKDRDQRKWLKREIRAQLTKLINQP